MHKLRVWQKADIYQAIGALVVAITAMTFQWAGENSSFLSGALCLYGVCVLLLGMRRRSSIQRVWQEESYRMGLKRILVIPLDGEQEKRFELHLMYPKESITKRQLLQEFVQDIQTLYDFAKKQMSRTVFIGTTHIDLWRVAQGVVEKLGLKWETADQLHDPYAPMSTSDWRQSIQKFYGRKNASKCPSKEKWKTFIVKCEGGKESC